VENGKIEIICKERDIDAKQKIERLNDYLKKPN